MNIHRIQLSQSIYWRLTGSETISRPLEALGGFAIVTPFYDFEERKDSVLSHPCRFEDGTYLFLSNTVTIAKANRDEKQPLDVTKASLIIDAYLSGLRVVTGQCRLPREPMVMQTTNVDLDFAKLPSHTLMSPNFSVKKHVMESAVKWEHLYAANDAVLNDRIEIHRLLINDAAEALAQSNFKSCILFSAVAVEACAGKVLDTQYRNILEDSPRSTQYRIHEITVSKDHKVVKDPVYESLRGATGDSGSKFLPLLHECSLYLRNKSLQYENKPLYDRAHALYRTRNSIAHTGTTELGNRDLLPVGYSGALEAVNTANDVFEWFGEKGTCVPSQEMVEIKAPRGNMQEDT